MPGGIPPKGDGPRFYPRLRPERLTTPGSPLMDLERCQA